jgi:alpha-1,6-mannosyltransferase
VVLAAPGTVVVPAAHAGAPGWLLGPFGHGLGLGGRQYYGCLWLALIAYLAVARCAPALGPRVVWTAIVAAIALFALAPPLLSQDAFSYISYARMSEVHGVNPYDIAPIALPADAAFRYVGWVLAPSAYGPLFSIATRPLGLVGVPSALWIWKAAVALCVLGLAVVTAKVARRRGADPLAAAAFVALNPVVLVDVVGGAHNDAPMMLLAMAGVLAALAGRELIAGAGLALAATVKISGGLAAPFALIASRSRGSFLAGVALALAAVLAATIPLYGHAALDSFALLGDNQNLTTRLSLPRIVSNLPLISLDAARVAGLAAYGVALAWLLAWTWRGGDWIRAAGWASFGLLLATSWILPWYLLWVLPLAAVARDRALVAATVALTALQLAYGVPWT